MTFRIGYLVPSFPSQTHAFFWREIQGLREWGADVRLVSTRQPEAECRHAFVQEARQQTTYLWPPRWGQVVGEVASRPVRSAAAMGYIAGLKETSLPRRIRASALVVAASQLRRWCESHKIDHLHANSCGDSAHLAALCRLMGGPRYSLTLHGDLPVYGTDHASKMRGAAFVAVVTRPLQTQVHERIGLPIEKLPVIWMGVDTRRFTPVEKVGEAGKLRIVHVARLGSGKGHDTTLRAVRAAVDQGLDVTMTAAGEGPHRPVIESLIRELKLEDRATLLGTVSEDRVRELHETSDVCVLPSVALGEAAPVSVMEAMACGKPVICSIIGGTADMIRDDVDGFLVPQHDQEAFNRRVIQLAKNPDDRVRLGTAARQRALAEFDYRAMSKRLFDRIGQCMDSPKVES